MSEPAQPPGSPATLRPAMKKSPSSSNSLLRSTLSHESLDSFATAQSAPSSANNGNSSTKRHPPGPSSPSQSHTSTSPLSQGYDSPDNASRRFTPTPKPYSHQSDGERFSSRWDSEDTARGISSRGALSDGHHRSVPRSTSARPSTKPQSSRLHTLNTSSLRNFNTASSSPSTQAFPTRAPKPASPTSRRDGTPLPPLPPGPPPSKNLPPPPARQLGRARSASLLEMATTVAQSRERDKERDKGTDKDAENDARQRASTRPISPSNPTPLFTVLVVGSPQCGKSVFISKGLKQWNLSRERTIILGGSTDPQTGTIREIRATARTAYVAIKPSSYPIEVLEVSSTELLTCRERWPEVIAQGSPAGGTHRGRSIDGLVVCYNIVDKQSWDIAKTLLSHASEGYKTHSVQAIVIACKTDLLEVPVPRDPSEFHPVLSGHSMDVDVYRIGNSHHYEVRQDPIPSERTSADLGAKTHKNLGLVPVAHAEGVSRKKMSDAFNWLFKRLERARRDQRSSANPSSSSSTGPRRALLPPATDTYDIRLASPANEKRAPSPSLVSTSAAPKVALTLPATNISPLVISASPTPKQIPPPIASTPSSITVTSSSSTGSSTPIHSQHATTSSQTTQPPTTTTSNNPPVLPPINSTSSSSSTVSPPSVRSPTSPTRARSTSDLTSEMIRASGSDNREREKREERNREYADLRAAVAVASASNIQDVSHTPPVTAAPAPSAAITSTANGSGILQKKPSQTTSNISVRSAQDPTDDKAGRKDGVNGGTGSSGLGNVTSRGVNVTVSMLPAKTPKESPAMQFATFDELLDKLFFVCVTDDDPMYVQQFLLIFRAFSTPRRLLLGMQKRLRSLAQDIDDVLLAKFAQMRICSLLDSWLEEEPGDLAAPGAEPAFRALLNHISQYTHLAHYASDLYPYLGIIHQLTDVDRCWSMEEKRAYDEDEWLEADEVGTEALGVAAASSVSIAVTPDHEEATPPTAAASSSGVDKPHTGSVRGQGQQPIPIPTSSAPASTSQHQYQQGTVTPSNMNSAMNKTGISLTAEPAYLTRPSQRGPWAPPGAKPNMKELLKVSSAVAIIDPARIAEEITRIEVPLFLAVEPRDWLRHTIGRRKATKAGLTMEQAIEVSPQALKDMARFYNFVAKWTASIILVHDRPRARAKIMEKMMGLARALRALNNYSGLRAVVSGINMARKEKDPVTEIMSTRPAWKAFQSLEVLLGTTRMHSAYRMALKHTVGPAIPSMEVHTYDLVRADDTNCDFKPGELNLVHWGKFSLMAKMIINVTSYQDRFEDSNALHFQENKEVNDLLMNTTVMDDETMNARNDPSFYENYVSTHSSESSTARIKSFFRRQ